jgi:hypothetical protein
MEFVLKRIKGVIRLFYIEKAMMRFKTEKKKRKWTYIDFAQVLKNIKGKFW